MDLWDRGIHTGLVGDVLAEGKASKGSFTRSDEEEEDHLARSFYITLLLVKM